MYGRVFKYVFPRSCFQQLPFKAPCFMEQSLLFSPISLGPGSRLLSAFGFLYPASKTSVRLVSLFASYPTYPNLGIPLGFWHMPTLTSLLLNLGRWFWLFAYLEFRISLECPHHLHPPDSPPVNVLLMGGYCALNWRVSAKNICPNLQCVPKLSSLSRSQVWRPKGRTRKLSQAPKDSNSKAKVSTGNTTQWKEFSAASGLYSAPVVFEWEVFPDW